MGRTKERRLALADKRGVKETNARVLECASHALGVGSGGRSRVKGE